MRESRKSALIIGEDLVGLAADFGYATRQIDVLVLAVHAAKGVAGQRAGRGLAPRHDDAGVQSTSERDADAFSAIEITGQSCRESVAQVLVVAFGVKRLLFFPFARLEISGFL